MQIAGGLAEAWLLHQRWLKAAPALSSSFASSSSCDFPLVSPPESRVFSPGPRLIAAGREL